MKCSLPAIWKSKLLLCSMSSLLICYPLVSSADGDSSAESQSLYQPLGLTGSLRLSGFDRDKSFADERGYLVSGLWLRSRPQEFWGIKSTFDFRTQFQNLARTNKSANDLREAYFERSFGNLDVKVGRQIIVWGRADKANPTDNLSVKNLSFLATDDEDQRLGLGTLQAVYNFSDFRVITIWQPEWRNPVLPVGTLPSGGGIGYQTPDKTVEQVALKIDHSGGVVDWSASYLHGIDRNPDIATSGLGPVPQLNFVFSKIDVVGADAATVIGNYGVRSEAAYTKTSDSGGNDPTIKNSNLYLVAGADRTFWGSLNINIQYLYRHVDNFRDSQSFTSVGDSTIAQKVNIFSNQIAENMNGISFRINQKSFNETLDCEVAFVGWFNKGDFLIRPKITYAFSDNTRGIVGAEIYNGPADSLFGNFKDISSGFAEFRYLF